MVLFGKEGRSISMVNLGQGSGMVRILQALMKWVRHDADAPLFVEKCAGTTLFVVRGDKDGLKIYGWEGKLFFK